MIDITKYIIAYRSVKGNKEKEDKIESYFTELFSKTYSAICLDVDKTIRKDEKIDEDMLSIFEELLKKNTSLCFITGMGRTKSKETLLQVYKYMEGKHVNIRNITCATSNGAIFLDTSKSFLDVEEKIVKDTTLEEYTKMKSIIRNMYISEVLRHDVVDGKFQELIERSIKSSGDMSLRFVFDYSEVQDDEQMTVALKEILLKTDLAEELYVLKGKHKDKLIWELSLADKLKAVRFFQERYGLKDIDVVKLGDQGKINGNDFNMLNSYAGFSVDEIESTTKDVLPIIDDYGNIITGTGATKKILKDLDFNKER